MHARDGHNSARYAEAARRERMGIAETARRAALMQPAPARPMIQRPVESAPRDTASGMRYTDAAEMNGLTVADPGELLNDGDPIQAAALPFGSICRMRRRAAH